ncbi:MAG: ATP-binding protein [Deltaproteobacteria bacterium]|nr:ATP-binding protein [Deltaproteobacteria bacterium]
MTGIISDQAVTGKVLMSDGQTIVYYSENPDLCSRVGDIVYLRDNRNTYCFKTHSVFKSDNVFQARAYFIFALSGDKINFSALPKPKPDDPVYRLNNELEKFFAWNLGDELTLNCFELRDLKINYPVQPEKLFAKHMGIFGCTGSGKSWSLASIIEECQNYNSKILLIDTSGEYKNFKKCVSLGFSEEGTFPFTLPYLELLETDLYTIFQPSDGMHLIKLKSAVKSLKLAKLEPKLSVGGYILKANRDKREFNKAYQKHFKDVEKLDCKFDISKLPVQLQNECVFPQQSAVEPNFWGGINSHELALCAPLIGKIEAFLSDPDLKFIFDPNPKYPSLIEIIKTFVEENSKQILRISLANLTTSLGIREVLVNITGRVLFHLAKQNLFMKRPLLFVIDEAHQFLSEHALGFVKNFSLSSLEEIAKQSRKFSLCLVIATQQPREISSLIISQLGCCLVHRLNDPMDFELMRPILALNDNNGFSQLSNLKTGEAYLAGVDFEKPVYVSVKPPDAKPISHNADFQKGWKSSN